MQNSLRGSSIARQAICETNLPKRAFRPDAGRNLTCEKIILFRPLTSKRERLAETRKRLLAQINAHVKPGSADMFEAMEAELKDRLDRQITELEVQIEEISRQLHMTAQRYVASAQLAVVVVCYGM